MTKKLQTQSEKLTWKERLLDIRNNKTILACVLFCTIYLISGYCKWIEILACASSLIFMIFLPVKDSLCLFMFLHSFTKSKIAYDSCFMATIVGYTIILLVKFIIGLKKGNYKWNKTIVYSIAVFYMFGLVGSLFRPWFYNTLIYLCYLPLFYLIFEMRKEFDIKSGLNYMFAGLITSCCLGLLIFTFPQYQYSPLYAGRFSAMFNNPNHIYIRALFLLSYYAYQFLNNNLSSWKFCVIYGVCATISLSCLSKTGIFMLALMSLIFVTIYLKQDFKKRIINVLAFILVVLVVCVVCFRFIIAIYERIAEAFASKNMISSLLTDRDDIWKTYIAKIFESPFSLFLGNGMFTTKLYSVTQGGPAETHNFYIFLLYRFGIVGTMILGYIIYHFIKELNPTKPKFIASLPLLFLLIESLFDNTMKCYNITYFLFAIMILFLNCKEKGKENSKNTRQTEIIKIKVQP